MEKIWNEEEIKQAVSDYNCWRKDAAIMCDTSSGGVWTDVFADQNDRKIYHSNTIHELISKRGMISYGEKTSIKKVKRLLDAGAYKYDSFVGMPDEILELYL